MKTMVAAIIAFTLIAGCAVVPIAPYHGGHYRHPGHGYYGGYGGGHGYHGGHGYYR